LRRGPHTLALAIVVSLGGFLFGFDASVISGVIRFVQPQFDLNEFQLGWVVSSPSASAMVAMLLAGSASGWLGRKRLLEVVAVLYIVSALMSALATGYAMLVVARMIGGAAFGAALILAPMYIAEIAPAAQRGRMVSIQQLNIVLGFSAAYFSNYLFLEAAPHTSWLNERIIWRWMLGIEALPATAYFLLLFLIPRSPRWLYARGRHDEARSVLERLHGADRAREELVELGRKLASEPRGTRVIYRDLLGPAVRGVFLIGLLLGILQQITGVNAIYFYATLIFEQSGIGANASFAQAVWVGVINVVFTGIAMLLIDRVGRRPLMLAGLTGVVLSMGITAYGFSGATFMLTAPEIESSVLWEENPAGGSRLLALAGTVFTDDVAFAASARDAIGDGLFRKHQAELVERAISMNPYVVLAGILFFVASFAMSLGPVTWVMLSELFPNRLRAVAISVVGFCNSLVSWFVQFLFPWELSVLGSAGTYLIYGFFALAGLIIVYRVLPETKGQTLEQIERRFMA